MEHVDRIETEDLDEQQFVRLSFERRWPKYVVSWSVRRRSGDSDFPVAQGGVERMPPAASDDVDTLWHDLRQEALSQAQAAVPAQAPNSKSFLGRMFNRD